MPYTDFFNRNNGRFVLPALLNEGAPISVEYAMTLLGVYGFHGAMEQVEGAVWRVERDVPTGIRGEKKRIVDFLCKYVRPDKVDGKYLPNISGEPEVWNRWKEGYTGGITVKE